MRRKAILYQTSREIKMALGAGMLQGRVWNWLCYPEPATSGDTDVVFEMMNEQYH